MGEDVSPESIFKLPSGQLPLFFHGAAGAHVVGGVYAHNNGAVDPTRCHPLPGRVAVAVGRLYPSLNLPLPKARLQYDARLALCMFHRERQILNMPSVQPPCHEELHF